MTFPAGRTVRAFREVRDRYGDTTGVDERLLHGVSIAPRVSTEAGGDMRTAVVATGLTMLVPDPADAAWLTPQHRVDVDGRVYRVQGDPARWQSPLTGWQPGTQVELDIAQG